MGIVQIVLEIIFTGGSVSIERLFAKSATIIKGFIKKAGGFADNVLQSLDKLISLIKKGSQNFASFIRQIFDDFFEWLKNIFKSGKADEMLDAIDDIKFINGYSIDKILAIPKGQRPNPFEYLTEFYIKIHLKKFENEGIASRIVLKKDYIKYGIGKPDAGKTEFVALKSEIDDLLKQCKGDANILSETLGIPKEQLEGGLIRIDFRLTDKNKVHLPSGNEFGTNPQWLPGGKLPKGELEAIIETEGMKLNKDYNIKDII